MCGIAGMIGAPTPAALRALGDALAHRGPDGEGVYLDADAGVGLVHRRLAIIDPTDAAAQPMQSCGGRYRVVFNGEIYNFRDIAADLVRQGYRFNPRSDTAILGPLFDRYGSDGLHRLNGIFAFALWDAQTRQLLIARDGFGVKPLYYSRQGGVFAFASELKALAAIGACGDALNLPAILNYLVHLWSPGAATPFAAVHKLPPGHFLLAGPDGRFEIRRWYAPPLGGDEGAAPLVGASAVNEVRAAFDDAVAAQCLSDVPIGAFPSGGVDSSAVVAAMVASGNVPKQAYCIGFSDGSMAAEGFGDDLAYARAMARQLRVPLTEVRVGEIEPGDIEKLPLCLDEPQADPAALYVGKIAAAARTDGIKVLLSGAGGDDVFSGYRRHRAAALRARFGRALNAPLEALPTRLLSPSGAFVRRLQKLRSLLASSDEDFLLGAFEFNARSAARACLTLDAAREARPASAAWLQAALVGSAGRPLVDRLLHLELMGFLPDHNLNYTDKAAMAYGVEVRVPFLDPGLTACAARIPWRLKTRLLSEKWVLKQAFSDRLPPSILSRKKTGFGAPVRAWFARGRLKSYAADVLSSQTFRERGLFDCASVDALLRDTLSGARDGAYLLLAILVIEHWLRWFADGAYARRAAGGQF